MWSAHVAASFPFALSRRFKRYAKISTQLHQILRDATTHLTILEAPASMIKTAVRRL